MKIKLMIFLSMTVVSLFGMQLEEKSYNDIDQKKIIECHKQNFPLFFKSIQTTRRVVFNFADFADTDVDMIEQTKIGIANGHKEIRKYLDGANEKILLFSQGKQQAYLNVSGINEAKLQKSEDFIALWTVIDNQEEIDASAIIYNISKDCMVSMSDHVSIIEGLNRKGKSKYLLVNIDDKIKERVVIDDFLKKLPIENVVVCKPIYTEPQY